MRGRVEEDDLKAITDPGVRANIHNIWCNKWLQENLTEQQRRYSRSKQTSMFAAWLRNHYGSKRFVMAIIETGFSWATPSGAAEHSPGTDIAIGAPEHTIKRFIDWILKVTKTIDRHKKDETVQEQRRRSGEQKHTSGLTEQ